MNADGLLGFRHSVRDRPPPLTADGGRSV